VCCSQSTPALILAGATYLRGISLWHIFINTSRIPDCKAERCDALLTLLRFLQLHLGLKKGYKVEKKDGKEGRPSRRKGVSVFAIITRLGAPPASEYLSLEVGSLTFPLSFAGTLAAREERARADP